PNPSREGRGTSGTKWIGLLLCCCALSISKPARAFDTEEFWREPTNLPFDVAVLEKGGDRNVAWQVMVYTSEIYRGEPMRIFAYYAHPAAPGKYPGVVHIHGGGGSAEFWRTWAFAEAGYACLSFDWNTFNDPPAQWKPGDPLPTKTYTVFGNIRYDYDKTWDTWGRQFFTIKPDDKAPVLYRAVMAARRALTWLSQRPEVDAQRLAVEGQSWGGFMTQLVAGIDLRVKAAVSSAAAGAWESRYRARLGMHLQELSAQEMQEWVRRYDPASYAGRVTAPLLVRFAASDFFASIDTLAEYWPKITAPKTLQLLPGDSHFVFHDVETRVAWFDHYLKGPQAAPAFPRIGEVTLKPGEKGSWTVRVQAGGPLPLAKGSVAWTTAAGPYNNRAWAQRTLVPDREAKAGNNESTWTASFTPVPAGGPLRVFASVRDAKGRVVSSLPIIQSLPESKEPPPATVTATTIRIARTPVSPLEKPEAWTRAQTVGPIPPGPEAVGEQSASLNTLWDDGALYLRVRVDDHSPWTPVSEGTDFWAGDSVHLRLRTTARAIEIRPGEPAAPEQNVLHIAWYPDLQTGAPRVHAVRGKDLSIVVRQVNAITGTVTRQDNTSYTLIMRIPWRFIDSTFEPKAGQTMRLGLQTVFGDLLTEYAVGAANLNNGHIVSDPASWGEATLVAE
ncbi:MAG: acetylxylan esterase, partial [Armatimonadota bacterium]|nr:acetylxylan esterase [Armatimonadota bacterium]